MVDSVEVRNLTEEADGNAQQSRLFAAGKSYAKQLIAPSAVIGLRSESFRLDAKMSRTLKYAIAFGKTADEAMANARRGLRVAPTEAIRKTGEYWAGRLTGVAGSSPVPSA